MANSNEVDWADVKGFKIEAMVDSPENSNPFTEVPFLMGTTIGKNCAILYEKFPNEKQSFIIIANSITGKSIKIFLEENVKPKRSLKMLCTDCLTIINSHKLRNKGCPKCGEYNFIPIKEVKENINLQLELAKDQDLTHTEFKRKIGVE